MSSGEVAMTMNQIEAKRLKKDAALRCAIREIVREELAKSPRRVCETTPDEPKENASKPEKANKVAESRNGIQSAITEFNTRHGNQPSAEETKAVLALETIKKALSAAEKPSEIILGRCGRGEPDTRYEWWKTFLGGLNLYPYVLNKRYVDNDCDHHITCICYNEAYLDLRP